VIDESETFGEIGSTHLKARQRIYSGVWRLLRPLAIGVNKLSLILLPIIHSQYISILIFIVRWTRNFIDKFNLTGLNVIHYFLACISWSPIIWKKIYLQNIRDSKLSDQHTAPLWNTCQVYPNHERSTENGDKTERRYLRKMPQSPFAVLVQNLSDGNNWCPDTSV
jgi:hypothetical protein